MTVTPASSGAIASMVTQTTISKAPQVQSDVNVSLLSDALDIQEALVTELLQSSGIGQNVDVVA